jgi:hypothetical protein
MEKRRRDSRGASRRGFLNFSSSNSGCTFSTWHEKASPECRRAEELARQKAECAQAVADALANGVVRNYGINLLWAHLQRHNLLIRRDDVSTVLRSLDPVGVRERRPDFKPKLRNEYIVPCPNFLWSVDGYDKFRNFGICIYGFIDAYSRKIVSLFVGLFNRTQVCVVK